MGISKYIDKQNTGFRRTLFYKILGLLLALTILSVVITTVLAGLVYSDAQRERDADMNLLQLQRTSREIDMLLSLTAEEMNQSMHTPDFLSVIINPEYYDPMISISVLGELKSLAANRDLIDTIFFYSPFSEWIYSSSGAQYEIADFEEQDAIDAFLNMDNARINSDKDPDWMIFVFHDRIYLTARMFTPIFAGAMFCRLNTVYLEDVICVDSQQISYPLIVYGENGECIFGKTSAPADSFSELEKNSEFISTYGKQKGSFYLAESPDTGWKYICSVSSTLVPIGVRSLVKTYLPFLIGYAFVNLVLAFYISRELYQPIRRLILSAVNTSTPPDRKQNEVDFLESVWEKTREERTSHERFIKKISADVIKQILRDILDNRNREEEQLQDTLKNIGMREFENWNFIVTALLIIPPNDQSQSLVESALYRRSLERLLFAQEKAPFNIYAVSMGSDLSAVIICVEPGISGTELKKYEASVMRTITQEVEKLPFRIILGRGHAYQGIVQVYSSYQEAVHDAQYQKYYAKEPGDREAMLPEANVRDWYHFREKLQQIIRIAAEGKRQEAEELADGLCRDIQKKAEERLFDSADFQSVIDEIAEQLVLVDISLEEVEWIRSKYDLHEEDSPDAERCGREIEMLLKDMLRLLNNESRKNRYSYVEEAQKYIADHFRDNNLSLNDISEYIGISASYLSSVFVDVTREHITAYLNRYRIEQSQRMLRVTKRSISEIGYECGFNSSQNYCRVFKKITGVTPNRYREDNGRNDK